MDNVTKALELYYEAIKNGVADVNDVLRKQAENAIESYQKKIDGLTASVNNSNLKIKGWQTDKINADKIRKQELSTYISEEREVIASVNLQIKNLKKEISNIKQDIKDIVESSKLIETGLKSSLTAIETEEKSQQLGYNLWYESIGEDLNNNEVQRRNEELLHRRLELQAQKILEVNAAYEKMKKLYGENHENSEKLENQLLSECVAYEKLKDTISNLAEDKSYSREEVVDIIYEMKDYLKENYQKLKDAGFTEEQIYTAARGATGYDKYLSSLEKKEEVQISDVQQSANDVIEGLNEKFTGLSVNFAESVEGSVSNLLSSVSRIVDSITASAGEAINNAGSKIYNNYTNNYTVSAGKGESITDSINALKNFEEIKKARGI